MFLVTESDASFNKNWIVGILGHTLAICACMFQDKVSLGEANNTCIQNASSEGKRYLTETSANVTSLFPKGKLGTIY